MPELSPLAAAGMSRIDLICAEGALRERLPVDIGSSGRAHFVHDPVLIGRRRPFFRSSEVISTQIHGPGLTPSPGRSRWNLRLLVLVNAPPA